VRQAHHGYRLQVRPYLVLLHLAKLPRPQCEQADPISMTFAPLFGAFRFTARSFCQRLMIWQCDQQGRHRQARGLLREAARGGRRAHRGLLDDEHRPEGLRESGLLMVPCVRRQTDRQTGRQTPTNNCCGPTASCAISAVSAAAAVQYAPCTATHSTCGYTLYGFDWVPT
jgi:hypothetical protein